MVGSFWIKFLQKQDLCLSGARYPSKFLACGRPSTSFRAISTQVTRDSRLRSRAGTRPQLQDQLLPTAEPSACSPQTLPSVAAAAGPCVPSDTGPGPRKIPPARLTPPTPGNHSRSPGFIRAAPARDLLPRRELAVTKKHTGT